MVSKAGHASFVPVFVPRMSTLIRAYRNVLTGTDEGTHPWHLDLRSTIASSPHVIVIGAGPAGSIAAIALARRGVPVTLIERSTFPRDKVCGECLSTLGIDTLRRLGVADGIAAMGPTRLTRSTLVAPDGRSHTIAMPRAMWGIRRSVMDAALVDVARSLGVVIEQPAVVTRIDAGSPVIVHVRREDGTTSAIDGAYAIVADGKSALLHGRPAPTDDFGLKTHFRDVDASPDAIELVGLGGGAYAGLAPVDGGVFNAAWSVPAATMRRYAGDLDRLFADHVASHAWLRRSFARATRVGDWLTCPLPRFAVRDDWPTGVVPIGNAAAALEPVGGEGMGLAMRSGDLAATAIADAIESSRPLDVASLRRAFNALWRRRRLACRAAAIALSDHRVGSLAIDLARCVPSIGRHAMRAIGK